MTYWCSWQHPLVWQRVLNLAFLVICHHKWARWLSPTCLSPGSSYIHKTTTAKVLARPFGRRHLRLLLPFHENTTQTSVRPCVPHLSSVASAPAPTFLFVWCPTRGLGCAALDSRPHSVCHVAFNFFICIMQCLTQLLSYRQHLNYNTNEIILHCNVWCCLTVHILCCYKIILRPSQWKLCKT